MKQGPGFAWASCVALALFAACGEKPEGKPPAWAVTGAPQPQGQGEKAAPAPREPSTSARNEPAPSTPATAAPVAPPPTEAAPSPGSAESDPTEWTRCDPLDLPDPPPCSDGSGGVDSIRACPRHDQIAVVVDDDSVTLNGNVWTWLQNKTWDFSSSVCDDASQAQPLERGLPKWCETIQRMGAAKPPTSLVPCTPLDARPGLQSKDTTRSNTPATKALANVCARLKSGTWGVVVFAFDSIPDSTSTTNPLSTFIDQAGSCVRDGLTLSVVAHPQTYRYLYVIAAPSFAEYARLLANSLSEKLPQANGEAIVLNLTPDPLLARGSRNQAAAATLKRVVRGGSSRPEERLTDDFGVPPGRPGAVLRLNLARWLSVKNPNQSAWKLTWEAAAARWNQMGATGLRLRPPEVWANQPLSSDDPASAFFVDSTIEKHTWDAARCPSLSPKDFKEKVRANPRAGCQAPKLDPMQSVVARIDASGEREIGTLVMQLVKDEQDPQWLRSVDAPDTWKEDVTFRNFRVSLKRTLGSTLAATALVSPAIEIDRCVFALSNAVRGTHNWGAAPTGERMRTQAPDLETVCKSAPPNLRKLVDAFSRTASKRFPKEGTGTPGGDDLRCGIETLGAILKAAGLSVLEDVPENPWRKVTRSCLLQGMAAEFECPAPLQ